MATFLPKIHHANSESPLCGSQVISEKPGGAVVPWEPVPGLRASPSAFPALPKRQIPEVPAPAATSTRGPR